MLRTFFWVVLFFLVFCYFFSLQDRWHFLNGSELNNHCIIPCIAVISQEHKYNVVSFKFEVADPDPLVFLLSEIPKPRRNKLSASCCSASSTPSPRKDAGPNPTRPDHYDNISMATSSPKAPVPFTTQARFAKMGEAERDGITSKGNSSLW